MIKKEEINALVANEIRQLDLENIFNEEVISKIVEATMEKMQNISKLVEEDETPEVSSEKEIVITVPNQNDVSVSSTYNPELPNFIDKIEPAKFIVFDRNELSVGGENLSNKPFRTIENPDVKKSIHQTWINDGKKRAEVYIAKLHKIGEIEFDYKNGTSQYIEKFEEKPSTDNNGFEMEPFEENVDIQVINDGDEIDSVMKNNMNIENKVKEYIEQLVRKNFQSKEMGKISPDININAITNNNKDMSIPVNEHKMRDIVMNDKKYKKIDTPEELVKSLNEGSGKAKLLSKNEEVQIWMLEGVEYLMPTNIISNKKCYTKKTI